MKSILSALALTLSFNALAIALSYDLCTQDGVRYLLDVRDQKARVTKNGEVILDEEYRDLHAATGDELTHIQYGFLVYYGVRDIRGAVIGSTTVPGVFRHLIVGLQPSGGAVMILDSGDDVGFTKWCPSP